MYGRTRSGKVDVASHRPGFCRGGGGDAPGACLVTTEKSQRSKANPLRPEGKALRSQQPSAWGAVSPNNGKPGAHRGPGGCSGAQPRPWPWSGRRTGRPHSPTGMGRHPERQEGCVRTKAMVRVWQQRPHRHPLGTSALWPPLCPHQRRFQRG